MTERAAKLRLIRSANIGPVTYVQLIRRFGSAEAAIEALPHLASRGGGRAPRLAEAAMVEREVVRVAELRARHVLLGDTDYPPLLAELETAPPALVVRGDLALATRTVVAMVGARNASAAARRFARELAHDLGQRGVVVASGLARGIDTAAHQGSLATGTIGVIASGIDIVFPPENVELQEEVAQRGLLISEQVPGREPLARHFPSRNRIIAGLAVGTVVVEAAPRSGSLITARLANEAGREVMAVPGSPLDPRAQGCNMLIRDGATLIQNADDVLDSLGPMDARMAHMPGPLFREEGADYDAGDAERGAISDLLGPVPVPVDNLIRETGFPTAIVQTVLLELELAGRLERHAGGKVSI